MMELFSYAMAGDFSNFSALNADMALELFPLIHYRSLNDPDFSWDLLSLSPGDTLYLADLEILLQSLSDSVYVKKHLVTDIDKEKSIREKSRSSYLLASNASLASEFELGDCDTKVKIVVCELIHLKYIENMGQGNFLRSEIFSCQAYQFHVLCILCHLLKTFPQHFQLSEVVLSLLYLDDMDGDSSNEYNATSRNNILMNEKKASFFRHGQEYVRLLLCNFPHEWDSLCQCVLRHLTLLQQQQHSSSNTGNQSNAAMLEKRNMLFERHRDVLRLLLRLQSSRRLQLLDSCIEQMTMPDIILELAIDMDGDREVSLISILKRILFTCSTTTRSWFCKFLQKTCSTNLLSRLDKQLFSILTSLTNFANPHAPELPAHSLMLAQQYLQVFAALIIHARRAAPHLFLKNILALITASVPISQEGNAFIVTSVAFLVAFYGHFIRTMVSGMDQIELESDVVRWLKHLLNRQSEFQDFLLQQQQRTSMYTWENVTSSGQSKAPLSGPVAIMGSSNSVCSHVELLLLVAIFCQGEHHQSQQLSMLSGFSSSPGIASSTSHSGSLSTGGATGLAGVVSQLLEVPIHASSISLSALQKIFLREVYREKVITSQLATMPVTKCLSANSMGYYPIHCVISLLRNRAFVKNKIDIKDWIFAQICACRRPTHPHLPELIDCFVNSLFVAMLSSSASAGDALLYNFDSSIVQNNSSLVNRPIPEDALSRLFQADVCGSLASECALAEVKRAKPISELEDKKMTPQLRRDYTPQILALYYLLKYHETMECRAMELNAKRRPILSYSRKIWSEIPFGFLLHYMSITGSDYSAGNLHSLLLKLIIELFPELQLSQYRLKDELMMQRQNEDNIRFVTEENNLNNSCPTPVSLNAALSALPRSVSWQTDGRTQAQLLKQLRTLLQVSERDPFFLVPFCTPLVSHLDLLLLSEPFIELPDQSDSDEDQSGVDKDLPTYDMPVGRQIAEVYFQLWCRLRILMPRRLHLLTLHAFRRDHILDERERFLRGNSPATLDEYEVYQDPIEKLLMYVEERVFRSPHALNMILRILDYALTCNAKTRFPLIHSPHSCPPIPHPSFTSGNDDSGSGFLGSLNSQQSSGSNNSNSNSNNNNNKSSGSGGASGGSSGTGGNTGGATSGFQSTNPEQVQHTQKIRHHYQLLLESTAVQVLLERCLPFAWEESNNDGISIRKECCLIICEYLHMLFIRDDDGQLCQLVHRQTYPAELLPMTVRSIPSLHIVLNNLQSNFQNSGKMDLMLFSLDLVSHLAEVYNIQKALQPCRVILELVFAFSANSLVSSIRPAFFLACVEPVVRIGCAFPCLQAVASKLLTMAAHQSRSELARLGNPVPAELKLPNISIHELLSKCRSLSLREQYEYCYFKCKMALDELSHKAHIQHLCYSAMD